ncbi:UDP-galactopyranose mutase [Roseibium sp. MMSF_3544]|uniref:UDP-galactopyranose mutase n=1 Tax=unclassified Roseibium TaxID=2629323 RepID=UPI00273FE30F|nr:UDP-galactopyranose mutase [Roseibium sp. MMSF_3544]
MRVCVVGAGFSGAVIARELAESGTNCLVVDERGHLAGNCHTERDSDSGIMIHSYGPHIFHTADQDVWEYVNRFGDFMPFRHQVKATVNGKVYSLPINLHTINQFFGTCLSPQEAKDFIDQKVQRGMIEPKSFEDQALRFVGKEIYEEFFRGYTIKQWGVQPKDLPASILKRLPLRFSYDDNYFDHPFQGMPKDGYTKIVKNILQHEKIELRLNCAFEELDEEFEHIFYSGPLDRYFRYDLGRLTYRTLDFEEIRTVGDFQGVAVMNYPDDRIPFTRITEHRHFAPWEERSDKQLTVVYREYSREQKPGDIPYYPVRLLNDKKLLSRYQERAKMEMSTTFVGRLGTYQYIDMDTTIGNSLEESKNYLARK